MRPKRAASAAQPAGAPGTVTERGPRVSIGAAGSPLAGAGPIAYDGKPAWFRNSIEIEGDSGLNFSDHGDSGSAIVNGAGELVGLLYAGNGTQTYACPIDAVVAALGIKL